MDLNYGSPDVHSSLLSRYSTSALWLPSFAASNYNHIWRWDPTHWSNLVKLLMHYEILVLVDQALRKYNYRKGFEYLLFRQEAD